MYSKKGVAQPVIGEHIVNTVAYLLTQPEGEAELQFKRRSDKPMHIAVEDIKVVQKLLDFHLKRKNEVEEGEWAGLDDVQWGQETACPQLLKNYFAIRRAGGVVATVAIDYDLTEGTCETFLHDSFYHWSGADLAAAVRLIDIICDFTPVLIWPNSVVGEYNERILQTVENVSRIDEIAAGTVSDEFRKTSVNKCAFLLKAR